MAVPIYDDRRSFSEIWRQQQAAKNRKRSVARPATRPVTTNLRPAAPVAVEQPTNLNNLAMSPEELEDQTLYIGTNGSRPVEYTPPTYDPYEQQFINSVLSTVQPPAQLEAVPLGLPAEQPIRSIPMPQAQPVPMGIATIPSGGTPMQSPQLDGMVMNVPREIVDDSYFDNFYYSEPYIPLHSIDTAPAYEPTLSSQIMRQLGRVYDTASNWLGGLISGAQAGSLDNSYNAPAQEYSPYTSSSTNYLPPQGVVPQRPFASPISQERTLFGW